MDMKFDLSVANWLACVADPSISIAKLGHAEKEKSMLKLLLNELTGDVFSLLNDSQVVLDDLKKLLDRLLNLSAEQTLEEFYIPVREYFLKKQWMALIIPSGLDPALDHILCDPELLGYLVNSTAKEQGLIFQLEEAPDNSSSLLDVHGVLGTALNDSINWPGILIWSPGGDSIFLPVSSVDCLEIDIEARVQWVFSKLFSQLSLDLGRFKAEYKQAFSEVFENLDKTVNILHLSDLDIGHNDACHRMLCVQDFIRSIVEGLGERSKSIPVITGNLMDNPSEKHLHQVRTFWEFISGMGTEEPLLVFGNNDVRKDGNINESYRNAVGFQNTKVTWYDEEKLAIISLNTVVHGNLPQGAIEEEQLDGIEYEIERKKTSGDYTFIILLHHLPINYGKQDSAMRFFHKRIVGESYAIRDTLEGVALLQRFVQKYSVSVFLHGHQQVPMLGQSEQGIPVIGCGRSVGNRSKTDDSVYFHINIISINLVSNKLSSRFLAIRKPENGLIEPKKHEMLFRTLI